jgi:hypothetical protein
MTALLNGLAVANFEILAGRGSLVEALGLVEWLGAGDVKVNLALDLGILRLGEGLSSAGTLWARLGKSSPSAAGSSRSGAWVLLGWATVSLGWAWVLLGWAAVSPWVSSGTGASSPSSEVRSGSSSGVWSTATAAEKATTAWSRSIRATRSTARVSGAAWMLGAREVWAGMLALWAAWALGAAVTAAAFLARFSAAATVMTARFALLNSFVKATMISITKAVIR